MESGNAFLSEYKYNLSAINVALCGTMQHSTIGCHAM